MAVRKTNVPKWKINKEEDAKITNRKGRNQTGRKPKTPKAKR